MFTSTSRYAGVPTGTITVTAPDGTEQTITYPRRRLLPRPADHTQLAEHTLASGERLDHVAARYLGDPAQFWRICDATVVLRPADLEETGRSVPISMPLASGPMASG